MKPQDWLPAPPPELPIPRFLVRKEEREATTRQLPQTQPTLTREDVRVEIWQERDRLHIGIQDKETGGYIVSWWDEQADAMFVEGFFYDPGPLGWRIPAEKRKFEESVLAYAEDRGILAKERPSALSPQTQPFAPPGVDSELEGLVEAKRREWEGKGYPPTLIARALTMAREWPASMFASRLYQAVRGTPAELEAQRQLYRMGLNVAQRWIEAMHRS